MKTALLINALTGSSANTIDHIDFPIKTFIFGGGVWGDLLLCELIDNVELSVCQPDGSVQILGSRKTALKGCQSFTLIKLRFSVYNCKLNISRCTSK